MMQQQSVVNQQLQQPPVVASMQSPQASTMQSNSHMTPAPQQQQQGNTNNIFSPPAGFYREHGPPPPTAAPGPSYTYSNSGGPVQTHTITNNSRLPQSATPSTTAGMHNRRSIPAVRIPVTAPPVFTPMYGQVTVNEPLLVQPPSLFNVVPPHWTYQVVTTLSDGCWIVRRRFRHVDALQDRLRQECPGAILPGRCVRD